MEHRQGVQQELAPESICFGCGPANAKGLRIASRWEEDAFVVRFTPNAEHQAFPGVINGGILGTLLDCHSNWCALTTLYKRQGRSGEIPCTVTAEFHVKLRRPTPFPGELTVVARAVEVEEPRVVVEAEVQAAGKVTATCRGVFVAVGPGHPAYHRWGEGAAHGAPGRNR